VEKMKISIFVGSGCECCGGADLSSGEWKGYYFWREHVALVLYKFLEPNVFPRPCANTLDVWLDAVTDLVRLRPDQKKFWFTPGMSAGHVFYHYRDQTVELQVDENRRLHIVAPNLEPLDRLRILGYFAELAWNYQRRLGPSPVVWECLVDGRPISSFLPPG
jgi:hypothetical protein